MVPFPPNGRLLAISSHLSRLFTPKTMSSSDVEMVDSGHLESEPEGLQRVRVAADVAAACRRGPERLKVKGKQYVWKQHEDNQRAFTTPSVIW